MSLWIVTHEHRFGQTTYLVEASEKPSDEDLIKYLEIDFEEEDEEFLTVLGAEIINFAQRIAEYVPPDEDESVDEEDDDDAS